MSEEKNLSDVAVRLRAERKRVGLSQDDLAAVGGVSRRTITAWESGEQSPNAAFLIAAAGAGLDMVYILSGARPNVGALSVEESALVDNYRATDERGRAAARAVLSTLAQPPAYRADKAVGE